VKLYYADIEEEGPATSRTGLLKSLRSPTALATPVLQSLRRRAARNQLHAALDAITALPNLTRLDLDLEVGASDQARSSDAYLKTAWTVLAPRLEGLRVSCKDDDAGPRTLSLLDGALLTRLSQFGLIYETCISITTEKERISLQAIVDFIGSLPATVQELQMELPGVMAADTCDQLFAKIAEHSFAALKSMRLTLPNGVFIGARSHGLHCFVEKHGGAVHTYELDYQTTRAMSPVGYFAHLLRHVKALPMLRSLTVHMPQPSIAELSMTQAEEVSVLSEVLQASSGTLRDLCIAQRKDVPFRPFQLLAVVNSAAAALASLRSLSVDVHHIGAGQFVNLVESLPFLESLHARVRHWVDASSVVYSVRSSGSCRLHPLIELIGLVWWRFSDHTGMVSDSGFHQGLRSFSPDAWIQYTSLAGPAERTGSLPRTGQGHGPPNV
jgi:hypothetical protein